MNVWKRAAIEASVANDLLGAWTEVAREAARMARQSANSAPHLGAVSVESIAKALGFRALGLPGKFDNTFEHPETGHKLIVSTGPDKDSWKLHDNAGRQLQRGNLPHNDEQHSLIFKDVKKHIG